MAEHAVPFLTLRNRTGAEDPADFYGDERSGLKASLCHLRELDFSVLMPLTDSAPSFIREEFLRVDQITEKPAPLLLDELREDAFADDALLYVHGSYISFEKGCRHAALFCDNAGVDRRLLWFAWPSDGALASYTHDEADLYWSIPELADAINELEHRSGAGVVDVIGHSLGARGVVIALYEVANRMPDIRLGEIVLLAPGMDFGVFQRILHLTDRAEDHGLCCRRRPAAGTVGKPAWLPTARPGGARSDHPSTRGSSMARTRCRATCAARRSISQANEDRLPDHTGSSSGEIRRGLDH